MTEKNVTPAIQMKDYAFKKKFDYRHWVVVLLSILVTVGSVAIGVGKLDEKIRSFIRFQEENKDLATRIEELEKRQNTTIESLRKEIQTQLDNMDKRVGMVTTNLDRVQKTQSAILLRMAGTKGENQ